MAKLGDFIAFQAAIALIYDRNLDYILDEVYQKSKAQESLPKEEVVNYVKEVYQPFTVDEISGKIAKLLTPKSMHASVDVVYQTIEGLHNACPNHKGDWYFTGNYPTKGGTKVVNNAFINYYEGNDKRAY